MNHDAAELSKRLARSAEGVCRHYLPNGRREGRYWLVGDVQNSPGRSLYVRLEGPEYGKGAAGKWSDAATGEHGDLLDLIAANRSLARLRDTLDEARAFLSLPQQQWESDSESRKPASAGSPEAARRLFAMGKPLTGTVAETYLCSRELADLSHLPSLRFHPRCYYRGDKTDPRDRARDAWPALLAAVTDNDGTLTGVHRTWLDPSGTRKAPVSTPRRAMGNLLGNCVRFGQADDIMIAGEGIETMLSLRQILPAMPMAAGLSANHLAAIELPRTMRRLYIARDDDDAGERAAEMLSEWARATDVEAHVLEPTLGDFNDDLRQLGFGQLADTLRRQLIPDDISRFWPRAGSGREGERMAEQRASG